MHRKQFFAKKEREGKPFHSLHARQEDSPRASTLPERQPGKQDDVQQQCTSAGTTPRKHTWSGHNAQEASPRLHARPQENGHGAKAQRNQKPSAEIMQKRAQPPVTSLMWTRGR